VTAAPERWVPSMALDPIDSVPTVPTGGVLPDFVRHGTRSWGREPVSLPGEVSVVLWLVLLANAALTTWRLIWAARCSAPPCWLVTLGGRPDLLLGLSLGCVVALAGLVPLTHGLTRAAAVPMALIIAGTLTGLLALLGVIALIVLVAAASAALVLIVAVVADR